VSDGLVCDGCGEPLLLDSDVRYILDVRGYAAYDVLEITREDLEKDLSAEVDRLTRALDDVDAREAEDSIHREFRFDLCPACWKRFVKDPLGGVKRSEDEE